MMAIKAETWTERTEFILQARAPNSRTWADVNKHADVAGVTYALRKFREQLRPEQTRMIKRYVQEWEIEP